MIMDMRSLTDVANNDSAEVGGKARNLAKLLQAGFPIPPGLVIPAGVCQAHFAAWGLDADTPEAAIIAKVRSGEFSPDLLRALATLPDLPFAVRSSATMEDGSSASYSGVFETVLGVRGTPALIEAVRRVWASALTPVALAYHRQVSRASSYPAMAVLLMPLVEARTAGVAFSAHPVDGNPFVIAVSANYGFGTTVVDGQSPVDRYLLDWDSLAVKARETGCKTAGEFLNADGQIEKRAIDGARQKQAALDDGVLVEIGQLVRKADRLFDARIDMEFAVTAQGITVLQVRPVLGLPPFFPDDPRLEDGEVFCCHQERMDPLSPYAQASLKATTGSAFPSPPWPMEGGELFIRHGRAFGKFPEEPELTECPKTPWNDRSFIRRMSSCADPALAFGDWYHYADMIYGRVIPSLRARSERVLRTSADQLRNLSQADFAGLVQEVIQLDRAAGTLYRATSYPSYETLRRIDVLIRDSLQLPWQESQQIALTMIQGAPKFTHLRDAEIEKAARTGQMEEVIAHWGYSYLRRDDLLDISTWRSWREDPTPLHIAISNLRKMPAALAVAERVRRATQESDARFGEVVEAIRTSACGGEQYAGIFAACVHASRRLFPLKDDRDLVLSHVQSAVRLVLCEYGRRLVKAGSIAQVEDIFLLHPEEIAAGASGGLEPHKIAVLADERREEQLRLARYTLPKQTSPGQEDGEGGGMFQGEPANAGIAEGPVRMIRTDHPEEITQLQPGEILWLRGEGKVGWTMYFPIIAGLIYNGNWLCHETNLCRELGIPAVIGIRDLPAVHTGDLIRINGATGVVSLIQRKREEIVSDKTDACQDW